jgi:hypothetical protein
MSDRTTSRMTRSLLSRRSLDLVGIGTEAVLGFGAQWTLPLGRRMRLKPASCSLRRTNLVLVGMGAEPPLKVHPTSDPPLQRLRLARQTESKRTDLRPVGRGAGGFTGVLTSPSRLDRLAKHLLRCASKIRAERATNFILPHMTNPRASYLLRRSLYLSQVTGLNPWQSVPRLWLPAIFKLTSHHVFGTHRTPVRPGAEVVAGPGRRASLQLTWTRAEGVPTRTMMDRLHRTMNQCPIRIWLDGMNHIQLPEGRRARPSTHLGRITIGARELAALGTNMPLLDRQRLEVVRRRLRSMTMGRVEATGNFRLRRMSRPQPNFRETRQHLTKVAQQTRLRSRRMGRYQPTTAMLRIAATATCRRQMNRLLMARSRRDRRMRCRVTNPSLVVAASRAGHLSLLKCHRLA